mmetsp:Transcript_70363/g.199674  ORF Transcript_70363/g.199674 Transcript_70363/m.199674 type:complete len:342 (-) Transcript_70363:498-1523(-)
MSRQPVMGTPFASGKKILSSMLKLLSENVRDGALGLSGADGLVPKSAEALLQGPGPASVSARIWNVYARPVLKPPIRTGSGDVLQGAGSSRRRTGLYSARAAALRASCGSASEICTSSMCRKPVVTASIPLTAASFSRSTASRSACCSLSWTTAPRRRLYSAHCTSTVSKLSSAMVRSTISGFTLSPASFAIPSRRRALNWPSSVGLDTSWSKQTLRTSSTTATPFGGLRDDARDPGLDSSASTSPSPFGPPASSSSCSASGQREYRISYALMPPPPRIARSTVGWKPTRMQVVLSTSTSQGAPGFEIPSPLAWALLSISGGFEHGDHTEGPISLMARTRK